MTLRVPAAVHSDPLHLVPVRCCVCDLDRTEVVGRGYDFEYLTSPNVFSAHQCGECGNVYVNPRPDVSEFARIYPPSYHSLEYSDQSDSLVHKIRSRLEARRLLRYCAGAPDGARILDLGCGDGFHLSLLRKYGNPSWTLEGVDLDARAVEAASRRGLIARLGSIEELDLDAERYDVVYTIQTLEHVAAPDRILAAVLRVLKPGGRLIIVTDNTDSVDFGWFKTAYWGGYHFPRHWNLFNRSALTRLAHKEGFQVTAMRTIVSPVNWVYSIHNMLVDKRAPGWLVKRFTLKAPVSLGFFTVVDMALQRFGRGALLSAHLTKPS